MIEEVRIIPLVQPHDQQACPSCRGAALHQVDHYEVGKLRTTIARELKMSREAEQELPLPELLGRWRASRRKTTMAATKELLELEDLR